VNTRSAAADSREISNNKGSTTIVIYSTHRDLLVFLLYKYYGIQHRVIKLVVYTSVEKSMSTTDDTHCCCTDSDTRKYLK